VNLRYAGTVEGEVYAAISARLGNIFSVMGQLPDGFEDVWVSAVLKDGDAVRRFPQCIDLARPPIELRYSWGVVDCDRLEWGYTTRTIADRQIDDFLRTGWWYYPSRAKC
jgi:hypothetical protein